MSDTNLRKMAGAIPISVPMLDIESPYQSLGDMLAVAIEESIHPPPPEEMARRAAARSQLERERQQRRDDFHSEVEAVMDSLTPDQRRTIAEAFAYHEELGDREMGDPDRWLADGRPLDE